jgi:hypothetical protein
MKKILITSLIILSIQNINAQTSNVRKLKNYNFNSSIKVIDQKAIISCGANNDTIGIKKNANGFWTLKNTADEIKINALKFNEEQKQDLLSQYDTVKGATLLDKLINRTVANNGEIKFVNDKENTNINENINGEKPSEDLQNETSDLIPKEKKNSDVILWSLIGGLVIMTALFLKEKFGKKKADIVKQDVTNNEGAEINENANKQIVQLQSTNQNLMEQLKSMQTQLAKSNDEDAAYFSNALLNLVNPAKTALGKQNKQEVVELAMQIMMQYIAITRTKMNTRQGSDDYVVKSMREENMSAQETKQTIIDGNTPQDKIPNELKTIIQILKDNNAELSNKITYMGYQLK